MNITFFILLGLELLVVAYLDLKHKKISNLWSLLNLAIFPVLLFLLPGIYVLDWSLLIFPLGFIVIGFILFLLDIMGAGDSKYLASLFLLIPLDRQFLYFEKLVQVTLIVGALLLIKTVLKNMDKIKAYFVSHHWRGFKDLIRSRFSYAPVMFLAWILFGMGEWL